MKAAIDRFIDHYATVTNGESALLRQDYLDACKANEVTERAFCEAFARAVAESFVAGKLDAERASFAMDDLFWSSECSLSGFALKVFDALEYRESTVDEIQQLLRAPMEESLLKSAFGNEAVLHRLWLAHLNCHGTQAAATITPRENEPQTLRDAWKLVQELASWLLQEGTSLPESERYEIIVGWSRSVRPQQGQIFKTGGTRGDLQRIVGSPTAESFVSPEHNPLRSNWQNNVFSK
jgi:hypothetical protein